MGGELPNSPIIIRVESNEARLNIGDEIAVRMRNGYLFFQDMNANMNFVNFMQAGDEYLLFLEHKFDFPDPKEDNLYFFSDLIIPGIFNYQDQDHIVIDVPVDDRYVPYKEVKDNEFFVSSEEALDELMKLKHELLKEYP